MAVQAPMQDLVVKDLHGIEWNFRHIYCGKFKSFYFKYLPPFINTAFFKHINTKGTIIIIVNFKYILIV
jgi:hypothetical protein